VEGVEAEAEKAEPPAVARIEALAEAAEARACAVAEEQAGLQRLLREVQARTADEIKEAYSEIRLAQSEQRECADATAKALRLRDDTFQDFSSELRAELAMLRALVDRAADTDPGMVDVVEPCPEQACGDPGISDSEAARPLEEKEKACQPPEEQELHELHSRIDDVSSICHLELAELRGSVGKVAEELHEFHSRIGEVSPVFQSEFVEFRESVGKELQEFHIMAGPALSDLHSELGEHRGSVGKELEELRGVVGEASSGLRSELGGLREALGEELEELRGVAGEASSGLRLELGGLREALGEDLNGLREAISCASASCAGDGDFFRAELAQVREAVGKVVDQARLDEDPKTLAATRPSSRARKMFCLWPAGQKSDF